MALFSKIAPTGTASGALPIKIAANSTPGTNFHTAGSGTVNFDEVWLYLFNSDTAAHVVTIEFGDTTAPDHNIVLTVQPKAGLVCAVPGLVLCNSKTVAAFADAANVITMSGFINRITA